MTDFSKKSSLQNTLYNSEVQCGQRVASIAISLLQYGQFLVVGAAGASSGAFGVNLSLMILITLTNIKITNAVIKKLITAVIKFP